MSSESRQRKLNQQRQKIRENQNKKHIQQLKSIQINDNETKSNLKFSLFKDECSPLVESNDHEHENTSKFAYDGPQAFEFANNSRLNDKELDVFRIGHNHISKKQGLGHVDKVSGSITTKPDANLKKSTKDSTAKTGFNYCNMRIVDSDIESEDEVQTEHLTDDVTPLTNIPIVPNDKDQKLTSGDSKNNFDDDGNNINTSNVNADPSAVANKQGDVSSSDEVENIRQINSEEDTRNSFQDSVFDSHTEIESFVSKPAPEDCVVKCRITRDRRGMDKGMYPTYYLHLERKNAKPLFLLAARRRKLSKTSNYLISCDATDMKRQGYGFLAKLRSNFIGTHFTIYDNGRNPESKNDSKKPLRKELAAIIYETNVLGFKGPRKMTVTIPGMTPDKVPIDFQPRDGQADLLECCRTRKLDNLLELYNKKPIWNEDSQSYVLNFHGRVTQASVKNFQIVHENDVEYIIMQFGRTSDNSFSMDYAYPLSAVQAFGIALSSFDGKLACE